MKIPRHPRHVAKTAERFTANALQAVLFATRAAPGFFHSTVRSTFQGAGSICSLSPRKITDAVGSILMHRGYFPNRESPDAPRFSVDVSGQVKGIGGAWHAAYLTLRVTNTTDEQLLALNGRTFYVEWDSTTSQYIVQEHAG